MVDLLVEWKHGESEHSLAVFTEPQVHRLEKLLLLSVDLLVLALVEDSRAEFPDLFGSALDVSHVVVVGSFAFDDRERVFVGGVEWHFGFGGVFALAEGVECSGGSDFLDGLVKLDECGFGGVSNDRGIHVLEPLLPTHFVRDV